MTMKLRRSFRNIPSENFQCEDPTALELPSERGCTIHGRFVLTLSVGMDLAKMVERSRSAGFKGITHFH